MNASSHHAYFILGGTESDIAHAMEVHAVHPADQVVRAFTRMSIDEVRSIVELSYHKAVLGNMRGIGIIAEELPWQSQNGLLKLFEDPPEGVIFFLSLPHEDALLPTLRSRLFIVDKEKHAQKTSVQSSQFLSMKSEERKLYVEKMLGKDTAKEAALQLLNECERGLSSSTTRHRTFLHDIALFRQYMLGPSPSLKFMLLHLAATLPRT